MEREEALKQIRNWSLPEETREVLETLIPELAESEDERIRKEIRNFLIDMECKKEWIAYMEKQKEQKPILSDRDSTDFEIEVHEIIAQARNDSRLNDADVLKQFEEEAAFALMLKANKLIEQKPAEWSEEEYGRLFDIEHYLDGTLQLSPDRKIACIDFLKSLRPQPKQEWSEEDRDKVAQYLHDRDGGMLWSKATEITSDIFDILRPLRPFWKPSEEQMDALKECGWCKRCVRELYEQLKKL